MAEKEVEMISSNKQREQRLKKKEKSLRDIQEKIRYTNISIIGVLKDDEKEKGTEIVFEKTMTENF